MSSKNKAASKRSFLKSMGYSGIAALLSATIPARVSWAKNYLTIDQAQAILFANIELLPSPIELTREQAKSIKKASKVRVRSKSIQAWRSPDNDWFIVDQIIGKHENIDMAFAINRNGEMVGLEVLSYRESYGHEIRHPKWRAQFHGKKPGEHLKLDHQIKNISGATLSCRHVTDGVNRLLETWQQVLQNHSV